MSRTMLVFQSLLNALFPGLKGKEPLLPTSCTTEEDRFYQKQRLLSSPSDFFMEPAYTKGTSSLPTQAEVRKWLKFLILIPVSSLIMIIFTSYYWVPFIRKQGLFSFGERIFWTVILPNPVLMFLIVILPIATALGFDLASEFWVCVMLLRGRGRRHLPEKSPRLVHAVIVCNYNEPLDVLRATIESIANNTLASNTIVMLACEDRDSSADAVFAELEAQYHQCFRSFFKTTHKLAPGELVGKSSNENYACRELMKMVQKEGIDPFSVMVTTCDADSLFDDVFLEQVEAEFCRMPDGRRFLYNSPINTYRNLPECNPVVRAFEILRCHFDTFKGIGFRPAQSNYSLTLGFANEINFWDPSNTSEDFHTTLKAMAVTGSGANIVVNVWSLILNDSVCNVKDRWVQAKRHMWGIEEMAFVTALFPVVRINIWLGLMARVSKQMFGCCTPTMLMFCFRPVREVFFSLTKESQVLIVAMYIAFVIYDWIKTIAREVFLVTKVHGNRKLVMKRSARQWLELVVAWPLLSQLGFVVFALLATWRMLFHAVFHETLVYVTAPKALKASPGQEKPLKLI